MTTTYGGKAVRYLNTIKRNSEGQLSRRAMEWHGSGVTVTATAGGSWVLSNLQYVTFTGDHLVQHGIHEESYEETGD